MRGQGAAIPSNPTKIGLPARPFFYTLDQLAVCLNLDIQTLKRQYLFYEGRSTGTRSIHLIVARNIAPPKEKPEWRVAEREFLRWLRLKKFRIYEVGVVTN